MDIMEIFNILNAIIPITNSMASGDFGALYCMILEEWCRVNDQNIIDYIDTIKQQIIEINQSEGKY